MKQCSFYTEFNPITVFRIKALLLLLNTIANLFCLLNIFPIFFPRLIHCKCTTLFYYSIVYCSIAHYSIAMLMLLVFWATSGTRISFGINKVPSYLILIHGIKYQTQRTSPALHQSLCSFFVVRSNWWTWNLWLKVQVSITKSSKQSTLCGCSETWRVKRAMCSNSRRADILGFLLQLLLQLQDLDLQGRDGSLELGLDGALQLRQLSLQLLPQHITASHSWATKRTHRQHRYMLLKRHIQTLSRPHFNSRSQHSIVWDMDSTFITVTTQTMFIMRTSRKNRSSQTTTTKGRGLNVWKLLNCQTEIEVLLIFFIYNIFKFKHFQWPICMDRIG